MDKPINWANVLTISRIFGAIICVQTVSSGYWALSAFVFSAAAISDILDGYLARRSQRSSPSGMLLDHSADAIFVTAVLSALCFKGYFPWILPILISFAFLQYIVDSKALVGRALRPHLLGKLNGIGYFSVIGIAIVGILLFGPNELLVSCLNVLGYLLCGSTIISIIFRLLRYDKNPSME